jgi:hypothetical protein
MLKQTCNKLWLAAALAAISVPAMAEDYQIDKGEGEAVGLLGVSDGNLTLGGAFGKGVTDKILAYGELAYIRGGSSSFGGFRASSYSAGFGGGIHYNFHNVFKNNPKLVPYAGAGLTLLRTSVSTTVGGASATDLFLNFGGGLRYYMKPNWGFRPEVMIFAGDGSFIRASVGLFYQF